MKILLATVLAVALFLAAAFGTYWAMPVLAPERVMATQRYLDSVNVALGLAPDSLAHPRTLAPVDSLPPTPDSLARLLGGAPTVAAPGALQDSLNQLNARLAAAEAALLQRQQNTPTTQPEGTTRERELASALTKLDDDELRAVVLQLDEATLSRLYAEATPRNRTRLLASIPPERAAAFVRSLIVPAQ